MEPVFPVFIFTTHAVKIGKRRYSPNIQEIFFNSENISTFTPERDEHLNYIKKKNPSILPLYFLCHLT